MTETDDDKASAPAGSTPLPLLARIVSGGQTGVDRAALDVALALGIACGGWVPRGRRAEDGALDDRYPMRETANPGYAERTQRNVRDSDATLILTRGPATGGTALTIAAARRLRRPLFVVNLDGAPAPAAVAAWLSETGVRVVNVAGPRESTSPGVYEQAKAFLFSIFDRPRR